MFAAPPDIKTEVFTRLPEALRIVGTHTAWTRARGGPPLHSFLEGPSFDRIGHLYCVEVAHGRIFRIAGDGTWELFADYDGNPNGLRNPDGSLTLYIQNKTPGKAKEANWLPAPDGPIYMAVRLHCAPFGGQVRALVGELEFDTLGPLGPTE